MINGHDPRAIANQILQFSQEKNIDVSMMKLIKLVFFAHGWMLGITGRPLSSQAPEAWQYGPVFRTLYDALPYQGAMVINQPIKSVLGSQLIQSDFSQDELNLMRRIVDVYGSMGAYELSDLTHEVNSPWHTVIQTAGKFSAISNELIQNYFAQKLNSNKNHV
jgi:uncharacterized phage-associated protein